jgi:lysophospholipase L1-like esterase
VSWARNALIKASLALVSLLTALLAAELTLAAIGFPGKGLEIELGRGSDTRVYHAFEDRHFVYDPDLIWRPKPGSEVFNSQGFRGPEVDPGEDKRCYRIFALGDSNTLGWAGEGGANWPGFLGELLGRRERCRVVVNAGVYGYSSHQGLKRLGDILRYHPDLVFLSFGSNDAQPVIVGDRATAPGKGSLLGLVAGRTRLGRLGLAAWRRVTLRDSPMRPRVTLEEYRDNLLEMIRLCRAQGTEPVLLTRPYSGRLRSAMPRWKSAAHRYNEVALEVGRLSRTQVVDVYSMFKGLDEFFADESHFTESGHRLLARILTALVEELGEDPAAGEQLANS